MRTLLLILALAVPARAADPPRTMRLDYYHTGDSARALFAVDKVVVEPLPWPGNPHRPTDGLNLGRYFFEVADKDSKKILYSRGFDSVFGEWVTTAEARTASRTFHESLRFPTPDAPVLVTVRVRDAKNQWKDVWTTTVDPKDMFVDPAVPDPPGDLIEIEKNGDPALKVDLLLLGDGYTAGERKKFEADARRLCDRLFATPPFKERRKDFNVWGLCPPARESGISRPSTCVHRSNPLGSTYDAFGSERYVLTFDNKAFRRTASFAPNDVAIILVNSRTYGGGGIFGQYSTVAADNAWAPYVFVHEFGHHLAGLADEYYTSAVAYLPSGDRVEPWEPNVTALLDPTKLKWKDLVAADTPVPTSWRKEDYDQRSKEFQKRRAQIRKDRLPEADMDALFEEEKKIVDRMLGAEKYAGKVGAFEGAMYSSTGYFRPEVNCIMFTRTDYFCAVCRRAIEKVIDQYTAGR
jgi:IgA Peptidase M64/Peptidase M64 N-terminus